MAAGADRVGAGQRIGDRRRALGAMLAAEPERTAAWLADEADRWSRRHLAAVPEPPATGFSSGGPAAPPTPPACCALAPGDHRGQRSRVTLLPRLDTVITEVSVAD